MTQTSSLTAGKKSTAPARGGGARQKKSPSMRLLILGTGGMANQHAKQFAAIEGVTLAGGVDVDPGRLQRFN